MNYVINKIKLQNTGDIQGLSLKFLSPSAFRLAVLNVTF